MDILLTNSSISIEENKYCQFYKSRTRNINIFKNLELPLKDVAS